MSFLRHLLLASLAFVLVGCQTRLSGYYFDPPIGKHPFRLHLGRDGTYSFEQTYVADARLERGRWWRIQDNVVMLVPDDTTKSQWFARVTKNTLIEQLRYSNDVRDVLRVPKR
jgi:uncharacterized lipoprotein YajG